MANFTPNFNLKKPLSEEFYNVEDQNGNMDIIDGKLKTLSSAEGIGMPDSVATALGLPGTGRTVAEGLEVLSKSCACVTGSYVGTGTVKKTFTFGSKVLLLRIFASRKTQQNPDYAFDLISDYFNWGGTCPFYTNDIVGLPIGNVRRGEGYDVGYYKWLSENNGKQVSIDINNPAFFPSSRPPSAGDTYNLSDTKYFYWAILEV